jgi:hypothetical protein
MRGVTVPRRLLPLLLAVSSVAACSVSASPSPSSLAAGTYTSKAFQPTVTYTLPTGWVQPNDTADYFDLVPVDLAPAGTNIGGIFLFRDPQPASQDSACPASPAPGIIAGDSSTLMDWIRGRPGFTVTTPVLVTVGGLPGVRIDVAIKQSWTNSCPFAEELPSVPLFALPGSSTPWTVAGSEQLRLYLLDRPGGGTIVVDVDAFTGSIWQALVSEATPIVQSLSFKTS